MAASSLREFKDAIAVPRSERKEVFAAIELACGGPGSGRKPMWHTPHDHAKLEKMHNMLEKKGMRHSFSSTNEADTMTKHHYIQRDSMGNDTAHADINERSNGYHNVVGGVVGQHGSTVADIKKSKEMNANAGEVLCKKCKHKVQSVNGKGVCPMCTKKMNAEAGPHLGKGKFAKKHLDEIAAKLKKTLSAGGPGSGRKKGGSLTKPEWQADTQRKSVLDNAHDDLRKKGFKYKRSMDFGGNKNNILHTYQSDKKSNGGGFAHITENKSGNHKAVFDSALSNFPSKLDLRV